MEISVEEPTLQPVSHDQAHDDMLLVVSDAHEIKTHIGKTLICPHCGKSLWKLNDFQNHVAKCAIKKFPCEFCNRRFPTKEAVEVHIKERHKLQVQQMIGLPMVTMPNVDCKCECTVCGDISENRELHFGHMKANHGHKVMCDYCTLTFTDDDELASHTKSDHNQASQKCYECTLCGIMFSSQQRYNMHKQKIAETCREPLRIEAENASGGNLHPLFGDGRYQPAAFPNTYKKAIRRLYVRFASKRSIMMLNFLAISLHLTKSQRPTRLSVLIVLNTFAHLPYSIAIRNRAALDVCESSSCHPEMIYSCRFCPRKFIEEAALLRHADNCAERIYSCSQCDASRKTLDEFKRHVALTGHAAEPVIAPELFTHGPEHADVGYG
ncbi:AAEL005570-PA [Aedes aegypti]|uniref:AAEL005570-PA n=1 Tax=Aedes aegypti TaxID=7159 RepID=Q179K6_AEDAE|nr:AAEL005570-PA [Aedes aegypti]